MAPVAAFSAYTPGSSARTVASRPRTGTAAFSPPGFVSSTVSTAAVRVQVTSSPIRTFARSGPCRWTARQWTRFHASSGHAGESVSIEQLLERGRVNLRRQGDPKLSFVGIEEVDPLGHRPTVTGASAVAPS